MSLISDEKDRKKFEWIYTNFCFKMQYIACQILGDNQEAENIVHDTFLTIIDHLDKIDEKESHKAWNLIITILKNKCYNCLKRKKKIDYLEDDVFEKNENIISSLDEYLIQKETTEILAMGIQNLKYPYKEVIILQYYNDLNSRQIAELLNLSSDYVRQISKRAKLKLKEYLLEKGYFYDK